MRVIIEKVPQRTDINSTIKPIAREDANAEIERDEIVFSPEKMTLHKALGKRHSQGGTPVNLNEGEFIFSDFNKLALSKKELELYELKEGGKYSKRKSTPAKILEHVVDLKHHNKMINILGKDQRLVDKVAATSAQLMAKKNMEKVGLIAFLQENKKNFEGGAPDFSKNSAPVYSNEMDDKLKQVGQYLKGGRVLRKFQDGDWFSKKYGSRAVPENGSFYTDLPTGYDNDEYISDLMRYINEKTGSKWNTNRKGLIDMRTYQGDIFGDLVSDAGNNRFWNKNKTSDKEYIDSKRPYYDAFGIYEKALQFANQEEADIWREQNKAEIFTDGSNMQWARWRDPNSNLGFYRRLNITGEPAPATEPAAETTSGQPEPGKDPGNPAYSLQRTDYNMPFTDWQKINMAYPFLKAATVKTYLPIRQHQESLIARPELISAQPQLNANNQASFNASQLARVVSPAQSASVISNLFGQRLDANNQVLGNVANTNNQITNNWRQQTAQTLNNDAVANRGFDRLYVDQVNTALQNRDDMRDYLINQGISNVNDNIAQRESFNQWMNSQEQIQTNEIIGKNQDGTPIYRTRAITEFIPTFAGFKARSPIFKAEALLNYNTGLTNQQQDKYMQAAYDMALKILDNPNSTPSQIAGALKLFDGRNRVGALTSLNRRRQ